MAPEYPNWNYFKKKSPVLARQVKPMVGKKKLRSLVGEGLGVITNGGEEVSEVVRFRELDEDQLLKASKQASKIHVIRPLHGESWSGRRRAEQDRRIDVGTDRRRGGNKPRYRY